MDQRLVIVLITLGNPRQLTGGYLYQLRMAELAGEHGAVMRFVSLPVRPFPLTVLDGPAALRRALSEAPSVLVLDSIAAAFLGPWVARRPPGVPLVGLAHQPPGGIGQGALRTRLQASLDWLVYRRAVRVIAASEWLAAWFAARGVRRERLAVVTPGRDGSQSGGGELLDLRDGYELAVLCVANWLPAKGIHALLEAFAALPPGRAVLHLVGETRSDRRYAARLERRLQRADLRGRVVVHGAVPPERVGVYYRSADLFVLPSYQETYGTVYAEALTAGLPVVGWRTGNLPYLIEQEREGLLVPTGDVGALAMAVERLTQDRALRERMAQAARERARRLPTWREAAAQFFGILRSVAAERVPRSS